jgi:hypothetical protein
MAIDKIDDHLEKIKQPTVVEKVFQTLKDSYTRYECWKEAGSMEETMQRFRDLSEGRASFELSAAFYLKSIKDCISTWKKLGLYVEQYEEEVKELEPKILKAWKMKNETRS